MPVAHSDAYERKLTVPFVLLILSLLALMVSLSGLARTASLANQRLGELQLSWESVRDGPVEGSELVATDRLMQRMRNPVPAVKDAAYWSLGLALLSILLLGWLIAAARRAGRDDRIDDESREKNEQAAVLKLMDEIAPLASGDLRVRATVTDSMTGALADAFNFAVGELRWLVGMMGQSALQLNDSVEHSRLSADAVARACAEQSGEIHSSSNDLMTMSGAMAELSADAADASIASQAAVAQAEQGAKALVASLQRLASIRDESESTARLMHRLVDNVAAINARVSVIEQVARRTDLLALNTTIRASADSRSASVSDAAADIGQLSDEIAQLADVLGQTTRDIGAISGTITSDALETVQSMERTIAELSIGVGQTQQAGDALQGIHRDTDNLRLRVVAMADKIIEQSGIVRKLSENMDVINGITRQTSDAVAANADSLNELQELASELRQRLSDFRLPARLVSDQAPQQNIATDSKPSQARKAADRAVFNE